MRLRRTLAFLIFACCLLSLVLKNRAAEVLAASHGERGGDVRHGDWTISKADDESKVEVSLIVHDHFGNSSHQSDWPKSTFADVDFSKRGRQDVHFTITRDAGKIDCEGFLDNGEGAGVFHFEPDPNYASEMRKLDFPIDEEEQYNMAVQDVSIDFARQMRNEHLTDLDTDKLIAFRIFRVDAAFVEALRGSGLNISNSDQLVAFRIHGVTPQMIKDLRQMGYAPDADTLIAMRIHGATPEWMTELKKRGYDHVDLEKLIAFRIHGVSPEFIDELKRLGYSHPDPDELVAMRIHNVTPEYITDLRSRGMHDLSIDQLVGMRIHGIN